MRSVRRTTTTTTTSIRMPAYEEGIVLCVITYFLADCISFRFKEPVTNVCANAIPAGSYCDNLCLNILNKGEKTEKLYFICLDK